MFLTVQPNPDALITAKPTNRIGVLKSAILTSQYFMKRTLLASGLVVYLVLSAFTSQPSLALINALSAGVPPGKAPKQPVLGTRSAKLIKVDGLSFKDLNQNGKLDKYEDWRLTPEERSKDLLGQMSLEEKVGFMLISTTRMKNDWSFEAPKNKDPITAISTKMTCWPARICLPGSPCPCPS